MAMTPFLEVMTRISSKEALVMIKSLVALKMTKFGVKKEVTSSMETMETTKFGVAKEMISSREVRETMISSEIPAMTAL